MAQFVLYAHKGGLENNLFHLIYPRLIKKCLVYLVARNSSCMALQNYIGVLNHKMSLLFVTSTSENVWLNFFI